MPLSYHLEGMFLIVLTILQFRYAVLSPVHFQEKLFDEGTLMEINFKNEVDENIRMKELEKYNLHNYPWHLPLPKRVVTRIKNALIRKPTLPPEVFYDINDPHMVKHSRKRLKRMVRNARWKRDTMHNDTEDYNYNLLRMEYYEDELREIVESGATIKIEPKKEDNRVKDAVDPIVDVKVPRNCTDKDRKGYGVRGIECVFKDLFEGGFTKSVKERFRKLLMFWGTVYALIATPLWLIKGWCCCCCRCEFCFPDRVVYKIKRYIVENPPGLIILANGKTKTYTPSKYEMQLFKSLEIKTHTF
ncbi:uncharacterized protein [Halyomorpha halys]|uniref:uncharacterized protein n=1 Tax=Halyomorpha halys TaxID=286706 RepID=UPI0006D4F25D|nr:uncharacterized protein LOC106690449 [Halyomorpha halys]